MSITPQINFPKLNDDDDNTNSVLQDQRQHQQNHTLLNNKYQKNHSTTHYSQNREQQNYSTNREQQNHSKNREQQNHSTNREQQNRKRRETTTSNDNDNENNQDENYYNPNNRLVTKDFIEETLYVLCADSFVAASSFETRSRFKTPNYASCERDSNSVTNF
jgi:hypothetical protein